LVKYIGYRYGCLYGNDLGYVPSTADGDADPNAGVGDPFAGKDAGSTDPLSLLLEIIHPFIMPVQLLLMGIIEFIWFDWCFFK